MFGNVTALEGLHVTGKYRGRSMQQGSSQHSSRSQMNGVIQKHVIGGSQKGASLLLH
jgi:hypothetical protein